MSTYGVRTRFVSLLVRGRGVVSDGDFAALVDYARERGITAGEAKALLQPAAYLETSRVLRGRGIGLDEIRFEEGAWARAEALARELGVDHPLARIPGARPDASTVPIAPAAASTTPTLAQALARGKDLGDRARWRLETPGATVTFVSPVEGGAFPAVVFDLPSHEDPAPTDLVAPVRDEVRALRTADDVVRLIRGIVERAAAYLAAEGVPVKSRNHRYGLQDLRRHALFESLARALGDAPLDAASRARVPAILIAEKERLLTDRDHEMDVGSHKNYWPYWDNYLPVLQKLLAQTPPGTDEHAALENRVEDVLDRKTVFGFARAVDERDLEVSLEAALVHRRPYGEGDGHRVSLAAGSWPTAPIHEILHTRDGKPVFRDADGKLRHDRPNGGVLSPEEARHITAKKVPSRELGIRPLRAGETARPGISGDWNKDGGISIAPIEIGWWGHCHNEAPLNAMGVDPQRDVEWYRADRRIPADKARQSFSAEDVWDACGALTADHEGGYATSSSFGLRETLVEQTKFVGSRNDGGHWILVEIGRQGARRVRVEAEITELWHKSDPTRRYDDPAARFRRDLPDADGGFSANPDWIDAGADDEDEITIDALGRRLTLTATFVTFDGSGQRREVKERVELDPTKDAPVKLADEILAVSPSGGGKLAEHWYNPRRAEYRSVTVEVSATGARRELARGDSLPVASVRARQETVYDSVIDIHDFITKNMGLPFTCDTSSGLAVWNYPVEKCRIDRVKEIERVEQGKRAVYTTYRLKMTTMGGPSVDAGYIIKRDDRGNAVRAVALDPMPDFAYRNEHWVCAPAALDVNGDVAYNVQALESGYLTDKSREQIVDEVWRRLGALVYASLRQPGAGKAWVFEREDGTLIAFDDEASFEAAVRADLALRS